MQAKILIISATLFLSTASQAEKWVNVGNGKNDIAVYADADSVIRKGDLASLKVREGDPKSKVESIDYDCPNRLVVGSYGLRDPIDKYTQFSIVKTTFDLACKRWFEVWK